MTSDGHGLLPKTPFFLVLRQLSPSTFTSSLPPSPPPPLLPIKHQRAPRLHPQPCIHPILHPPPGNLVFAVSTPPISSWPPNLGLNLNISHLISCANLIFPAAYLGSPAETPEQPLESTITKAKHSIFIPKLLSPI